MINTAPKQRAGWLVVYLVAIVLVYGSLHTRYRTESIDDAWHLSYAYNYVNRGAADDLCFNGPTRGVQFFGKTHAFLYGHLLNSIGWTKGNAHAISFAWMAVAAACWFAIVQRLGYSRRLAGIFTAMLVLLEPFFSAANHGRVDALCFCLASLSFLLFVSRRYGFGALVLGIAIESHPMGAMAVVWITAYGIAFWKEIGGEARSLRPVAARLLIGTVLGGVYYFLLHRTQIVHFGAMLSALKTGEGGAVSNALYTYYFRATYLRHLPELAVLVGAAGVYLFRRQYRREPFIGWALLLSVGFSLVVARSSALYAVYYYPLFLLLMASVVASSRLEKWLPALCLLMVMPQYGYVAYQNRRFDLETYLRAIRSVVPADGRLVVGSANNWFAFYDRPFMAYDYNGAIPREGSERFYLITNDAYRQGKHGTRTNGCSQIRVNQVAVAGERYDIILCERDAPIRRPPPSDVPPSPN